MRIDAGTLFVMGCFLAGAGGNRRRWSDHLPAGQHPNRISSTLRTSPETPAAADETKAKPQPRTNSKQVTLIAMLRRPNGADLDEIAEATGWQKHTIRGAIPGALKKKLGLQVTSTKDGQGGRLYRLPA